MPVDGARPAQLVERFAQGDAPRAITRTTIVEAPIAIEINGLAYAVMMATPADLDDFALGFCLSEQLIETPAQFESCEASDLDRGWLLRITLTSDCAAPLVERARLRLTEGSCGLCGIESLDQVLRPLPRVMTVLGISDAALFAAGAALRDRQPLGRATGAAHAAAFCQADGTIVTVREDVGRHNAFDKLIGALARAGMPPAEGFVLLSARCSFELVQKAVLAGVPVLATVSAASTLALDTARDHGLRLVSLLRNDSFLDQPA
ncbi:MAG: formate dehydrogenase accessory sulfurtransferase FdhD [Novosphingobium sp.]